ncbi:MAG: exosortase system-associated protein, TIGR04073 family [Verrucomicrobiota bacterium]
MSSLRKTVFTLAFVGAIVASMNVSAANFTEDGGVIDNAANQLGRGISNVAFGIFEVPANIYETTKNEGDAAGATTGVLTGLLRFGTREVVGVFEIVTFPVGMKPIIKPAYPTDHGLFSGIFVQEDRYEYVPEDAWDVGLPGGD